MIERLLIMFCLFTLSSITNATVIYLDSESALSDTAAARDSVTVSLDLGPGTYNVNALMNLDTVGNDAWNAWGRTRRCDNNGICSKGWLTRFRIFSTEIGTLFGGSNVRYETDTLALANFNGLSFTLTRMATVSFWINDSNYRDNQGGLTLSINKVNTPPMLGLMGLFLILIFVRFKCGTNTIIDFQNRSILKSSSFT